MKIKMITTADLKHAYFNPPKRTLMDRSMRSLIADIRRNGIRVPLIVTESNVVADGNRRLVAAREIGIAQLPCVITHALLPNAFRECNYERKALTGADQLYLYITEPDALIERLYKWHKYYDDLLGRESLVNLCAAGLSLKTMNQAVTACKYCARPESRENVQLVIDWIITHKQTRELRQYIDAGKPPLALWNRIESDRPLRVRTK